MRLILGEEDLVIGLASFLAEVGIVPALCASGGKSGHLEAKLRQVVDGYAGEGAIEHIIEEQEHEQADRIPRRIAEYCQREIGEERWTEVVTKIVVAEGKAHQQILDHARDLKSDLVVLGAHAESSLLERLLGNTAQRVVQRSPVPVLICQVPDGKQALSLDV